MVAFNPISLEGRHTERYVFPNLPPFSIPTPTSIQHRTVFTSVQSFLELTAKFLFSFVRDAVGI